MIDSNQIFKKDFKESYLLVSGGNLNISHIVFATLKECRLSMPRLPVYL